jgi:hypothetical protein
MEQNRLKNDAGLSAVSVLLPSAFQEPPFLSELAKIESSHQNQAIQELKTISLGVWSILLFLSMRVELPTWPMWILLPMSIGQATLLLQLNNLYELLSAKTASSSNQPDAKNAVKSSK